MARKNMCEFCAPGAKRSMSVAVEVLASGQSVELCLAHLDQVLTAREWLQLDSSDPFPTADGIRAFWNARQERQMGIVH